MKGYMGNIEQASITNENFRQVLYTAKHTQLVVMSIPVGGDIGEEVHELDQFLRIEAGEGRAVLDGVEHAVRDGSAVLVPRGTRHNIVNTGSVPLKLYTLYSPPNHLVDIVHKTKEDAMVDEARDHWDGKTTE